MWWPLFLHLTVAFYFHQVLEVLGSDVPDVQHACEKINLVEGNSGHIFSPIRDHGNGNVSYPARTSCAWYIKIQPDCIVTLSFSTFDLEEGRHDCTTKPCCGDTWLSILSIPSATGGAVPLSNFRVKDTVNLLYCGTLSLPPLVFSGSALIVTFKTANVVSGGKGFVLEYTMDKPRQIHCENDHYHCNNGKCILKSWLCNGWDECGDSSDELNCTVSCQTGYSHCSSNSSHCYDFVHGRCNGVFDCPGGEDEQACALNCGNQMPCRMRGGCYRSMHRCDGVNDCADGSDEEDCDSTLCGPHRDGFLCRNRRCIPATTRCDGAQDCGDYSDEDACMKMSVITAVILGSLICGLLLVIAAGCGLRLYHLRLALEQRWSTIRLQHRTVHQSQDFDEFGRRRPVMGRLPPPSYAQATGVVDPASAASPTASYISAHRHRSSGRVRRPAPPLPDPPEPLPQRPGSTSIHVPEPVVSAAISESLLTRFVRQMWRKRPAESSPLPANREDDAAQSRNDVDTEPLIESHHP